MKRCFQSFNNVTSFSSLLLWHYRKQTWATILEILPASNVITEYFLFLFHVFFLPPILFLLRAAILTGRLIDLPSKRLSNKKRALHAPKNIKKCLASTVSPLLILSRTNRKDIKKNEGTRNLIAGHFRKISKMLLDFLDSRIFCSLLHISIFFSHEK